MRNTASARPDSLTTIALRKLRRHEMALVGGVILVVLYSAMILAGFVSPYNFDSSARLKNFHPPTELHVRDHEGRWHRPFVYDTMKYRDELMILHYAEFPDVPDSDLANYLTTQKALDNLSLSEVREHKYRRHPIELFVRGPRIW